MRGLGVRGGSPADRWRAALPTRRRRVPAEGRRLWFERKGFLSARESAELGYDHFGEEVHRLGVGVVAAPRREPRAAEVDIGLDLLRHLLRGADQVALAPRLERLAPERARARGFDLRFGPADA